MCDEKIQASRFPFPESCITLLAKPNVNETDWRADELDSGCDKGMVMSCPVLTAD
jgi:hypothetical protein